ncbi:MAG: helix-turn-helix domain-containing protein [Candidatus Bathyarchaeota archaeon]|jgi:hypothetical protein
MNQENQNPNYFVIIPSHILDDPNIDDATALLFGRISSLSISKGYCFASDKYLANLTGVSHQEIGKRLLVLEENGYIHRDTQKVGLKWDRKIYLNFNYEHAERRTRTRQMADFEPSLRRKEQNKPGIKKDDDEDTPPPQNFSDKNQGESQDEKHNRSDADLEAKRKFVCESFPEENPENLIKLVQEYSLESLKTAFNWTVLKKPDNPIAMFQWALKNPSAVKESLNKTDVENELEYVRRYERVKLWNYDVVIGPTYVEFVGGMACHHFDLKDEAGKMQLKKFMQKQGFYDQKP